MGYCPLAQIAPRNRKCATMNRPHSSIDDVSYWSTRVMSNVNTPKDLNTIAIILQDRAKELARDKVIQERHNGKTWQEIGDSIGTTKQAAWEKFHNV